MANSKTKKKVEVITEVAGTAPSNPLTNIPEPGPMGGKVIVPEIGQSGTQFYKGVITEEYNPDLAGRSAMKIYDEMARSDATVKQALLAITLPIRRASWYVEPASQETQDVEIAEFIKQCLFNYMTISWDDILRQALLNTQYGVFLFEKVFDFKEVNGKTMIIWKKFAPRLPRSVLYWQMSDGQAGIQQILTTGPIVNIPWEKLLVFVHEKEGDNNWGISAIRAAYKPWYIKTNLEKIDAIANERQGMGIPYVKMQTGYSDEDVKKARTILSNMRSSEEGYLIEPQNITVEFKNMQSASTKDPSQSIKYHNRQILVAVLAQFLELGNTQSGSRSTSSDHSELFLKSLEAEADNVRDVIQASAIKELVDLNFDKVEKYPTLKYSGIAKADITKLADSMAKLSEAGAIKFGDRDQQFIREFLGMPEMEDEQSLEIEESEEELEPEVKEVAEDLEIEEETKKKDKKNNSDKIAQGIMRRLSSLDTKEQIEFLKAKLSQVGKLKNKEIFAEATRFMSAKLDQLQRLLFQESNDYEGWRKLTFAEKKVNLKSIEDFMDKAEERLTKESKAILDAATADFIKKMATALDSNDKKAISDLEIQFHKEYKDLLKTEFKKTYEFGKNSAAREMGVETPANSAEMLRNIDIAADTIAVSHAAKIEAEAKHTLIAELNKQSTVATTVGAIDAAVAKVIDKVTNDMSVTMVGSYINNGRGTTFDKYPTKIYALQRSEILDRQTCNFCLSMDGRVIKLDDPAGKQGIYHSNCRGIWVEILIDQVEKPEIDGIPDALLDSFTKVNDLKQPRKPITKEGGLAEELVAKKEKAKKK